MAASALAGAAERRQATRETGAPTGKGERRVRRNAKVAPGGAVQSLFDGAKRHEVQELPRTGGKTSLESVPWEERGTDANAQREAGAERAARREQMARERERAGRDERPRRIRAD